MTLADKSRMPALAKALGLNFDDHGGIDALIPYLEKMRQDGAVVVLKLDGQRRGSEVCAYTAIVSGGQLGDDYFRTDAASLSEAIVFIIINYAQKCWGFA
jgi:hypothetical protein